MDFDTVIDRNNTWSLKWDDRENVEGKEPVLPFWVADMDFAPPPTVLEAIRDRAAHPVFGYTSVPAEYPELVASWYRTRYNAPVDASSFLLGPGCVPSLGIVLRSLTSPRAGVLVCTPVYYPFYHIIADNGRTVMRLSLGTFDNGRFYFDEENARRVVNESRAGGTPVEAVLWCSPHNPGGRLWSRSELHTVVSFCRTEGLLLISDEIHGDLAVSGEPFVSLAEPSFGYPQTVVVSAPNKTFNLAGLHLSHFAVGDDSLRARLRKGLDASGVSQPNVFSLVAAHEAYRSGGPWLGELLAYLRLSIDRTVDVLSQVGFDPVRPDAGYLVWADARRVIKRLGLADDRELVQLLAREGRIRLSAGSAFGPGGEGHIRFNCACPRALLDEGLGRLASWMHERTS